MSEPTPPVLYLVDGSSYLFRAFHAMPPLSNRRGEPTGAVYGVCNMLKRDLLANGARHVAVIFDAKGGSFRKRMYPQYKANRPPMADELRVQIEPLHELVDALGLPRLVIEDVEADDVIATLTEQACARGWGVVISTGDKDLAQLVREGVTLVNTMTRTTLDEAGVCEKFGVPPHLIGDYLALIGDTSDNIPGIPKVGPKTAVKWLQQYGSLQGIVENAGEIGGKIGENLRNNLDQLALSRALVRLKDDVDLPITLDQLRLGTADETHLRALYKRLDFRSWLDELGSEETADEDLEATVTRDYRLVLDRAALDAMVVELEGAEVFALDSETDRLDSMRANLVGLSFATAPGRAWYVPLAHRGPGTPEQLPVDTVLAALKPLLEDARQVKIGQHIKYDMNVLVRYGIQLAGVEYDTMLESYVYNSTATRHNMDALARHYLDVQTIKFEDVCGSGAKQISFDQVALEQACPYAAEDADITLRLHQALWSKLQAVPALEGVYRELEQPLIQVLAAVERRGVLIDATLLAQQSAELAQRMATLEQQAFELAGHAFNLGSPKQLQHVLFEEMGITPLRKTPKGQPSTAEDVLAELALDHPLPARIMEHRTLNKLKSTYTDRLPEQINPNTGRVHTSYHQAVAATGRLSSSDPNLQNIPIRRAEGRRVRTAFIAPEGYVLLASDYSQIELRIMAHLSGDDNLLRAMSGNTDVHSATAAEVFAVDPDAVSRDQRRAAKAINFGLMYGMSAFGLARQLKIERSQAQAYIDTYFQRYPGVHEFMERTRFEAHQRGYVETLHGRRLYLTEINVRNRNRQQGAERAAINAPMQGSAADIIKRAMIDVHHWLLREHPDTFIIMQVHDELVLEVPAAKIEEIRAGVDQRMVRAADLAVPLVVDHGTGANWEAAH